MDPVTVAIAVSLAAAGAYLSNQRPSDYDNFEVNSSDDLKIPRSALPQSSNIYSSQRMQEVLSEEKRRADEFYSKAKDPVNTHVLGPTHFFKSNLLANSRMSGNDYKQRADNIAKIQAIDNGQGQISSGFGSENNVNPNQPKEDKRRLFSGRPSPGITAMQLSDWGNSLANTTEAFGKSKVSGVFQSNNQNPFVKKLSQPGVESSSSSRTVENFTGVSSPGLRIKKDAVEKFTGVGPVLNDPVKKSLVDAYARDRFFSGFNRNHELPSEQKLVAAPKAWTVGNPVDFVPSKTIDELRQGSKVKTTYKTLVTAGTGPVTTFNPDTGHISQFKVSLDGTRQSQDKLSGNNHVATRGTIDAVVPRPEISDISTNRGTNKDSSGDGLWQATVNKPDLRSAIKLSTKTEIPRFNMSLNGKLLGLKQQSLQDDYGRSSLSKMAVRSEREQSTTTSLGYGGARETGGFAAPWQIQNAVAHKKMALSERADRIVRGVQESRSIPIHQSGNFADTLKSGAATLNMPTTMKELNLVENHVPNPAKELGFAHLVAEQSITPSVSKIVLYQPGVSRSGPQQFQTTPGESATGIPTSIKVLLPNQIKGGNDDAGKSGVAPAWKLFNNEMGATVSKTVSNADTKSTNRIDTDRSIAMLQTEIARPGKLQPQET